MLLLIFSILVTSTPLASVYLSSIFHRIAFLILLLSVLFSCNILHGLTLLTEVDLLGGLLQTSQYLLMHDTVYSILVPIMIYHNASTEKSRILTENKGKAGIYLWTHLESNKKYVGSAVDLSIRLNKYYSPYELKRVNNYIRNALICHNHSVFSLSIIEYIDISNLSKDEARALILEKEQHYLDSLQPEYNILKKAGSLLGFKHSEDTITKISGKNHHRGMQGKTHSAETLALMSLAKSSENHPRGMQGKTHSTQTLALMSLAKSGENHPRGMLGKTHSAETLTLMSLAKKDRTHTSETLAKMSAAKGTTVYVYNNDKTILVNTFSSANKAGKYFKVHHHTILSYLKNGKIFKGEWFLSTSLIINE
jgi:group I intron endonuclease